MSEDFAIVKSPNKKAINERKAFGALQDEKKEEKNIAFASQKLDTET